MRIPAPHRLRALLLAAAAAGAALAAAGGEAAGASRECGSFGSQAAAQAHFVKLGGGPAKSTARHLDDDRDGVACESLGGPYSGFASLGYNKRKRFFYGYAWLPSSAAAPDQFACLYGNRHFPDGPRLLTVHRVGRDGDKPLRRVEVAAQADPTRGRLSWRMPARQPRGRFYVAFEERIPLTPYGANECPGFRSRTIVLPRPRR
jgi:hypothetical protein